MGHFFGQKKSYLVVEFTLLAKVKQLNIQFIYSNRDVYIAYSNCTSYVVVYCIVQ
jgi:hypothetical protein